MKKIFKNLGVILFILLSFIWIISEAKARAWWWTSSRSSDSSSSSSSSSSYWWSSTRYYSNSWSSSWTSSPSWVVFIIIIIIIFAIISSKNKNKIWSSNNNHSSYEPEDLPEPASNLDSKLTQLKESDPGFNEQIFSDRVSTAFFKIQDAWCKTDMNLARAFITDSVLNRFNMQLEEYRQSRTFNKLEWLCLDNTEILDISIDSNIERIDVLVTATAKDYKVDEDWNYVSGNKNEAVTWDEKWFFVRNAWVKTNEQKSVFSEKCPNCGAPLKVNAKWECEYCRSVITTGKFDWVLSEIKQLNS